MKLRCVGWCSACLMMGEARCDQALLVLPVLPGGTSIQPPCEIPLPAAFVRAYGSGGGFSYSASYSAIRVAPNHA